MNYLAHFYLSYNKEMILVGNYIADAVKGKDFKKYIPEVEKGILLHRYIDHYTDTHKIAFLTRQLLQPVVGKYSGVVQDMFYDHFLAINWEKYSKEPFEKFCLNTYKTLSLHVNIYPERMKLLLHYMSSSNWLGAYKTIDGIDAALKGLAKRTKFRSNMEISIKVLKENYNEIENHFLQFFPDLENVVKIKLIN